MKRIDRNKVESKLKGMLASTQLPEPLQLDDLKQRAEKEFFRREELQRRRKELLKRIFRRAGIAVAAAACLLVASFVYTVCAPVTISNANNFVRRATLWINNTLQLGFEFPVPIDDENTADLAADGELVFDSVEAASQAIGLPLVHLSEESGAELVGVEVRVHGTETETVYVRYIYSDKRLLITLQPNQIEQTIAMQNSERTVETRVGTVWLWECAEYIRGRMITADWNVVFAMPYDFATVERVLQNVIN